RQVTGTPVEVRSWRDAAQMERAEHVCSARVIQTSTCSAMARASSTSMPRYLTVLSIFVCPNSSWTAGKLPVRRYMSVALVRRRECVPKKCGSRPIVATQFETSRAYCRVGHAAVVITTATEEKFARFLASGFDV